MKFFNSLFNTFFFLGKIPIAPGTIGSIGALILWYFLPSLSFLVILCLLLSIICFSYSTILSVLKDTSEKDPQSIVIDEVIGMWIALLPLYSMKYHYTYILIAFLLFRFLDIIKPSIINRIQFIPGPWGILLDDIVAGIITSLIVVGIMSI